MLDWHETLEALVALVGREGVVVAHRLPPLEEQPDDDGPPQELRRLTVPTLLIWGDHDPVGAVKVAQATARLVPEAQLEVLPAGHVSHLGNPERVSKLLSRFVRSGSDG